MVNLLGCTNYIGGDFANIQLTSTPLALRFFPIQELGLPEDLRTNLVAAISHRSVACDNLASLSIRYEFPDGLNSGNFSMYASIITLGILPTYWTNSGRIVAEILDAQGAVVKRYVYTVRFHTWYGWIPLLLQSPDSLNSISNCHEGSPRACLYHAAALRLPDRLTADMRGDPLFASCTPRLLSE